LKYVVYGKVFPHPDRDNWLLPAYQWLGHYCGYCPQMWLSRGDTYITGARNPVVRKQGKYACLNYRRAMHMADDSVVFCFDTIIGFPVDYEAWCGLILGTVINTPGACPRKVNQKIAEFLDKIVSDIGNYEPGSFGDPSGYPLVQAWMKYGNMDDFLKHYVFVERDQVVVPSLNLKSAKKVVCRNEKQKKALRRMGFIEDRIEIRNMRI
jgi:hypothetical protein